MFEGSANNPTTIKIAPISPIIIAIINNIIILLRKIIYFLAHGYRMNKYQKMAKKAMRIHQREGISLKRAWARVYPKKDRQKPKKYKKVPRAQKAKSAALARKAMRMHWREGISLKAAWKKVRGKKTKSKKKKKKTKKRSRSAFGA